MQGSFATTATMAPGRKFEAMQARQIYGNCRFWSDRNVFFPPNYKPSMLVHHPYPATTRQL
ncbi:unnamed protein product [Fusarium graminearum]|uniref:Chromosome 2, complete genome n=2 Tax=Gibberella zeae TaxID=5518 RepID=A0A098DJ26_GIBZE|nr:unnamed protein product [Fusarium graminearum]CAF3567403.1 unnamed protein product [Fusarium graminearum]CAG1994564.1 unnamed protein product [Fusarium graminearum]CAG2011900.1 unnamed protein product [Fusarium graminearum]CEF78934.1 unnamed protein product [Fusarium graminearum]